MKNLIKRFLFGTPIQGETVDLAVGKPRVMSTYEPAEKAGFNEVFQNVHRELQAAAAERLGIRG